MPRESSRASLRPRVHLLCALLLAGLSACGDDGGSSGSDGGGTSADLLLRARERAAAHATEDQWADVVATLDPLVADADAADDDLLWAAIARWELLPGTSKVDQELAAARALLARIQERDPGHPGAAWVSAQLALAYDLDPAAAAEHARTVLAARPDDVHALLFLGRCHQELGELDEAKARYEDVRRLAEQSDEGLWAVASYKLGQLLVRSGSPQEGMALIDAQSKIDKPGDKALDRGSLAVIAWPEHAPQQLELPATNRGVELVAGPWFRAAHDERLRCADLDGDGRLDLVGFDDTGLSVALQSAPGEFTPRDLGAAGVHDVLLADLDGDDRAELAMLADTPRPADPGATDAVVDLGGLALTVQRVDLGEGLVGHALSGPFDGLLAVDLDHEGDLDVLLFGDEGARVLRNDGGAFADGTPAALSDLGPVRRAWVEDVDGDNDVDIVLITPDNAVRLLSSQRGGRFVDATAAWLPDGAEAFDLDLADLDGDRHPDLALRTGEGVQLRHFRPGEGEALESTGSGRFIDGGLIDGVPDGHWGLLDVDGNGVRDLFVPRNEQPDSSWWRGPLEPGRAPGSLAVPPGSWLSVDLLEGANDGLPEVVVAGEAGVQTFTLDGGHAGISLSLEGLKDNALGLGSVVEVRAGELYSRHYVRGPRTTLALGGAARADIVRVTWPNGVAQHLFDVPAGPLTARQPDRASGSCPFLYVFDGERWHFVSDVLGATPLGLPMAPGQMVPFDHEEYVKIDGPMLRPDASGLLRVALTEELREVTYLDRVRLHAIDHPADVEIQPDEGFVFPPFPAHHVHTVREAVAPFRAVANLAADGEHGYGSTDRTDVPNEIPYAQILLPLGSEATHPSMLEASKLTPFDGIIHSAPHLGVTPEPHDAVRGQVLDLDALGFRAAHTPEHLPHVWDAAEPCEWNDVPAHITPDDMTWDASRLAGPRYDAAVAATPAPVVDVAQWLTHADTRCPRPFRLAPDQLQGLTEPWSLDLDFGFDDAERQAIRNAPQLRLLLTGWLQWGDASVNMAAARHPDFAFVPPVVWVPDGERGWRPIGPPVGFPAGKTKTLVVDLTEHLDRDDPRVRITTTLELSWDRIALAVDGDDAPYLDTTLEPAGAELSFRGLSGLVCTGRDDLPEIFDWDVLSPNVPWDAHPGRYTAYGDIAPLLGAVDDEYALLGSGDVAHVTFDASALPELPAGWTRDWLLFLDGWAKDRDPNTLAAERVEPLPFHGMSAYPPPAGEAVADPAARAAWDATWNTRDARRLLPDLRPR